MLDKRRRLLDGLARRAFQLTGRGGTPSAPGRPLPVSLALQGGGSFGAFTWGVLDRLLEEDGIVFDAVSGASAGAVNAVALAAGLASGGRTAAREVLERVWRRISGLAGAAPFGAGSRLMAGNSALAAVALDVSTRLVSPYQFNPLGLNPLRDILAQEVDFELVRTSSPIRLLVAATRVSDGRLRIFRNDELSVEAVLASSCLPLLHHAVSVDGEMYWDGGYTANPPLTQLATASKAADLILVQLTPTAHEPHPRLSPQIVARLRQIAFNTPLQKEIEALATLQELSRREGIFSSRFGRRLQRLRLHRIAAEDAFEGLARASALDVGWPFLLRLRDSGRAAAGRWLAAQAGGERQAAA